MCLQSTLAVPSWRHRKSLGVFVGTWRLNAPRGPPLSPVTWGFSGSLMPRPSRTWRIGSRARERGVCGTPTSHHLVGGLGFHPSPVRSGFQPCTWVEKKPVDNPCILMPQYRSVSVFFLCIGLQCFGSSGSKVATFPYKCSMRSTLCQLPAPAGNRNFQYKCSTQSTFWQLQLESSNFSVVCAGHFGSSGSKVAAFQCKQV